MADRRPFWKWCHWKSIGFCLWPPSICIWNLKIETSKQTWLALRKPCRLQSRNNKQKKNTRRHILKMMLLKINRLLPIYISIVPLKFGVDYQSQTKVRVRKVTSLKINRLLPMTTINMHMKFQIEIPKQTWLMLRKPCRLQTDGRTDGQGESSIPPNFVGRGIIIIVIMMEIMIMMIIIRYRWLPLS